MTYTKNLGRMQDDTLLLIDTTSAITADALATVGGSAANGILDIGATDVMLEMIADVTAFDTTTGDELVKLQLLGSNSSSFASGVVHLGALLLGGAAAAALGASTGGLDTVRSTGKHSIAVRNRIGSTVYRYVRLNIDVSGTTPSITFGVDGVQLVPVIGA
jgi:hypothetical protein